MANSKDYMSHDEVELTLSCATEKGWTVYAINPDTLDMNLSIKVNFTSDDSYALVGELTQQNAINTFDKDLNLNISYFLEKGILKQRIKKYKPCTINLKINYMLMKRTSTVVGDSGIIYRGKEEFNVDFK